MWQLQLFETYAHFFSSIEQQLQKGKFPIMLFKNITKRRDIKEKVFRITQSTFITTLRTKAVEDLKKTAHSTNVVSIHVELHLQTSYTQAFTLIYMYIYSLTYPLL
jgi:hypothetical protein